MKTDIYQLNVTYGLLHAKTAHMFSAVEFTYRYKSIKLAVDTVQTFLSILSEDNTIIPTLDPASSKIYYNQVYRNFRSNNEKYIKYFYFLNSEAEDKSYKVTLRVMITPEKILTKASTKEELQTLLYKKLTGSTKTIMLDFQNSIQDSKIKKH